MFGIGIPELTIILVIILIVFGVGKLPEIGGGMGKAIRNFKKATKEVDEINDSKSNDSKSNDSKSNDSKSNDSKSND